MNAKLWMFCEEVLVFGNDSIHMLLVVLGR